METWSKSDLSGLVFVVFGIICLMFSDSTLLTNGSLLIAALCLLHGIYWARYDSLRYREMLCHYQSVLSSSTDGWIAWNAKNQYVGSSKKIRELFSIKQVSNINVTDILNVIDVKDAEDLSFYFNKLKKTGESFLCVVQITSSKFKLQLNGARMIVNGVETVVIWCLDITDSENVVNNIEGKLTKAEKRIDSLTEILNVVPFPIWMRNSDLSILFCNKTYADYLGSSVQEVIFNNMPLIRGSLFGQGHSLAENAKKSHKEQSISQFMVINSVRKKMLIHENPANNGNFIGFATDITNEENLSSNLERVITASYEVLENLSTAIAIFGENTRITFFNSAYAHMMKLDANWLHSKPTYGEILDENRNNRQIPEYADFQAFKKSQAALFTSITAPQQELMHLPNGRTLRLVIAPYPLSGLLFIYEDVTDSLALQRRNNVLVAVQNETIEHLYEGVMVYGSDNRLKIINQAMKNIWGIKKEDIVSGIHIEAMLDLIKDGIDYGKDWILFKENAISNLTDRIAKTGKLMKKNNITIMFSYTPLPDGAHMHSCIDITDTCNVEKAIVEKNQTMEITQRLRLEFVTGISTELREPLNVLMGFAELLTHQYFGALNEKQFEYCQFILDAANQLHMLINNLMEMVTIDIESKELNLSNFSMEKTIDKIISTIEKRAKEKHIDIIKNYENENTIFNGDEIRIKQAIFNVLINALQFTPPNGKINVRVCLEKENLKIIIKDEGIGVAKPSEKKFFKRANMFSFFGGDNSNISMPLVRKLIELHNGTMHVSSDLSGTTVICSLPMSRIAFAQGKYVRSYDKIPNVVNS